jgi:hypothetical protein
VRRDNRNALADTRPSHRQYRARALTPTRTSVTITPTGGSASSTDYRYNSADQIVSTTTSAGGNVLGAFGLGAAIGEATASYVSTGKVNWCTAAVWGVGATLLALMFP